MEIFLHIHLIYWLINKEISVYMKNISLLKVSIIKINSGKFCCFNGSDTQSNLLGFLSLMIWLLFY